MDSSSLTPIQFNEHPELAALRILKTTLEVAELALQATYRDHSEDSERCHSEQEAYAIAILHQIEALGAVIDEYFGSIRRLEQWRDRELSLRDVSF